MKGTLFLFHTTLGIVKAHEALQTAGIRFWVTNILRELRGGCRLCIYIDCIAGREDEWVIPGHTESIYRLENGD